MAAPDTDTADPIEALRSQHGRLGARLADLADDVIAAADDGDATTEAMTLFSWYRSELLPHFKAEEAALYARGRERETTSLLVQGLIADHQRLRSLFEDLDAVTEPGPAAAAAGAVRAVFDGHTAKENDLLLPALSRAGVAISEVVHAKPELAGRARREPEAVAKMPTPVGGAGAVEPISGTEDLDVRALSHQARHGIILGKMQALTDEGKLVLINDHDPLPLRYQADAMWPGEFEWTYVDEGPEEWRVEITRV